MRYSAHRIRNLVCSGLDTKRYVTNQLLLLPVRVQQMSHDTYLSLSPFYNLVAVSVRGQRIPLGGDVDQNVV